MSYSASDKLPKDFFQNMIEEKAEMIQKYLRDMGDPWYLQPILNPVWPHLNFIHIKKRIPLNYIIHFQT